MAVAAPQSYPPQTSELSKALRRSNCSYCPEALGVGSPGSPGEGGYSPETDFSHEAQLVEIVGSRSLLCEIGVKGRTHLRFAVCTPNLAFLIVLLSVPNHAPEVDLNRIPLPVRSAAANKFVYALPHIIDPGTIVELGITNSEQPITIVKIILSCEDI
jgi:hypothetical protein